MKRKGLNRERDRRKRYGRPATFEQRSAGRVSGLLGHIDGIRRGCYCCFRWTPADKRARRRAEERLWRRQEMESIPNGKGRLS